VGPLKHRAAAAESGALATTVIGLRVKQLGAVSKFYLFLPLQNNFRQLIKTKIRQKNAEILENKVWPLFDPFWGIFR
jgi:hypothetical protein